MNPWIALAGPIGQLLDKIIPDPVQREKAKLALAQADNLPLLKQIEVNITEAQHASWFVAGWRPFIGWVCGVALAYAAILSHLIASATVALGGDPSLIPAVDTQITMTVLMGLLGLGGLRTYEKVRGAEGNR